MCQVSANDLRAKINLRMNGERIRIQKQVCYLVLLQRAVTVDVIGMILLRFCRASKL